MPRSTLFFGVLGCSALPIGLGVSYLLFALPPPGFRYASYNVPLGSALLLAGIGVAIVFFRIAGDKDDVFERGIVEKRLGKTTAIHFAELNRVTRAVMDIGDPRAMTRQTRVSLNTPDGRVIVLFHNSSLGTWNENLDLAFQMGVNAVTDRMQRTLGSSGSVAWVKIGNVSATIRPEGLVIGGKFYEFARLDMEAHEGTCYMKASGSVIFEVNAGAVNFYPGVQLIQRLRGEPAASRLDSMVGQLWHMRTAVA